MNDPNPIPPFVRQWAEVGVDAQRQVGRIARATVDGGIRAGLKERQAVIREDLRAVRDSVYALPVVRTAIAAAQVVGEVAGRDLPGAAGISNGPAITTLSYGDLVA